MRKFIGEQKEELGINLKEEVLPMSDVCGYLRPYVLNHGYALRCEKTFDSTVKKA